jgi:hypothetical protein
MGIPLADAEQPAPPELFRSKKCFDARSGNSVQNTSKISVHALATRVPAWEKRTVISGREGPARAASPIFPRRLAPPGGGPSEDRRQEGPAAGCSAARGGGRSAAPGGPPAYSHSVPNPRARAPY